MKRYTACVLAFGLFLMPSLLFTSDVITTEAYTPTNINGGWIRRVVEAPSAPGTFYAVSYGVFKSIDGGHNWERLQAPTAPATATDTGAVWGRHCTNSIAVSSTNANNIVVADSAWSAVWASLDGGQSWTVNSFDGERYENYQRAAIVASSLYNPDYFFVSIEKQMFPDNGSPATLYMSTDKGLTWKSTGLSITANQSFCDVLQMPSGRIVVTVVDTYLGFNRDNSDRPSSGKIYYSDDATTGETFTLVSSFDKPVYKMTWDATHDKIWLITSEGEIYASADGETWGSAVFTIPGVATSCHRPVGILYSDGGSAYPFPAPFIFAFANENSLLYRSTAAASGFISWVPITLPSQNDSTIGIFEGRIEDIVVDSRWSDGSHWGIASSDNAFDYTLTTSTGISVVTEIFEQTGICTNNIYYGIKDKPTDRVFALAFNGVFYSQDNGSTWEKIYPKKGKLGAGQYLTLDPSDESKLYLINDLIILSSHDRADYFDTTLVNFILPPYSFDNSEVNLTNMLILPTTNVMYVGLSTDSNAAGLDNYLYKSIDGGSTWSKVIALTTHGIYYLALDPHDAHVMYAGCGNDWEPGGSSYFNGSGDGLYRTEDGGETWTNIGFEDCRVSYIALDPDNDQFIAAGYDKAGQNSRTSISTDRGATWDTLMVSYADDSSFTGEDVPANPHGGRNVFIIDSVLYAGTWEGFVFRGNNYGVTPLQCVAVMPTAVNWIFEGSLYAATGAGLYSLNIGDIAAVKPYTGDKVKAYNFPNPFNPNRDGGTVIRVSFPSNIGTLKLKIYSLSGDEVVEDSFHNITGAYSYAFIWDGRNQRGDLCAPGLYFLVVDADGSKKRHKIVMVR